MAFEIAFTTTKPADKAWWWELNPSKMSAIDAYMEKQTGYVGYESEMKDANTRTQKIIFETSDQVSIWRNTLYANCPEANERKAYNDANGFVTIITISKK